MAYGRLSDSFYKHIVNTSAAWFPVFLLAASLSLSFIILPDKSNPLSRFLPSSRTLQHFSVLQPWLKARPECLFLRRRSRYRCHKFVAFRSLIDFSMLEFYSVRSPFLGPWHGQQFVFHKGQKHTIDEILLLFVPCGGHSHAAYISLATI